MLRSVVSRDETVLKLTAVSHTEVHTTITRIIFPISARNGTFLEATALCLGASSIPQPSDYSNAR